MKNPSFIIWAQWFGCTIIACAMLCAFVFLTFQTKSDAAQTRQNDQMIQNQWNEHFDKRMDKLEEKVDRANKALEE